MAVANLLHFHVQCTVLRGERSARMNMSMCVCVCVFGCVGAVQRQDDFNVYYYSVRQAHGEDGGRSR